MLSTVAVYLDPRLTKKQPHLVADLDTAYIARSHLLLATIVAKCMTARRYCLGDLPRHADAARRSRTRLLEGAEGHDAL